jgi:hypothetical protein
MSEEFSDAFAERVRIEDERIEAIRKAEQAITRARVVGRARRKVEDFMADQIELALYKAKEPETINVLVQLARTIFADPRQ